MKKKVTKKRGRPIFVVGHVNPDTDTVCSAIAYAYFLNHCPTSYRPVQPGVAVPARAGPLSSETSFVLRYFRIALPRLVANGRGKNLILVDHNDVNQAVPNINEGNILEIIDHHRIGDIETVKPIPFTCQPCGSTCSIIANRFFNAAVPVPPKLAGVMLAGLLSDTIMLKSPTTTPRDRDIAHRLSRISGLDIKKFGVRLLQAGSLIVQEVPIKMLTSDLKCYGRLGSPNKACIGQISITDGSVMMHKKDVLLQEMERLRKARKLKYFLFMITNILSMETELLVVAEHHSLLKKVEHAFGKKLKDNSMTLANTVSRKLQVQPNVLKLL